MLLRENYLTIIDEVRNCEKIALDGYIYSKLIPLQKADPSFIRTLYKDIEFILNGVDEEGDNDLIDEGFDFAVEDGDFKLSGYQTRLHDLTLWLHLEIVKDIAERATLEKIEEGHNALNRFMSRESYTPEYRNKLLAIRKSVIEERNNNYSKNKSWFKRWFSLDFLELKPNVMGVGINLNEILNRIFKRK